MALGLGILKLAPHAFWSMSPKELEAVLGVRRRLGGLPLEASELARLMALYPDS